MPVTGTTLVDLFRRRAEATPDLAAMRHRSEGSWRTITYREWSDRSRDVANGLLSLGIEQGDCVALLSRNRPEWHVCDLAILLVGARTVPLYVTKPPAQIGEILAGCAAKTIFVEDPEQLDKVRAIGEATPQLAAVVVLEPGTAATDDGLTIPLVELTRLGRSYAEGHPAALDERAGGIQPDDVASVVYTSGTTGPPKGAVLSHRNFVDTITAGRAMLGLQDGERVISYLSYAHVFERLVTEWASVHFAGEVWFAESLGQIAANLQDCRPTFFIGVPRVYEKLSARVKDTIAEQPAAKRALLRAGIASVTRMVELGQAGRPVPALLRIRCRILDRLVLRRVREALGMDRCKLAVSGAAALPREVAVFVHAIGIRLLEGYGLTESTAPAFVNPPGRIRIGTVGLPLEGVEARLAPDGEILLRGTHIFQGYLGDDDATAAAFTPDGWLCTGDIGTFDEAGYLRIVDRKKDLIKTSGGTYIAPQELEGRLMADPLVSQAVVIGDARPYPTALLTLDLGAAARWAAGHGVAAGDPGDPGDLSANPEVLGAVESVIRRLNTTLSRPEQIKRWTVLPGDFTEESGELTSTFKARRAVVMDHYRAEIERMYA